jgi:DNA-binding NarL/FixJ family response regulator
VILTTFDGDADIHRGIRAGARSYLIKDVRREDLFECIRQVHAGRTFIMPEVAQRLASGIAEEKLSDRELAVLRLLTAGQPNKLIGAALDIAEVTVKSHVQAIFRKLNVMSRTEAALVAQRRGWLHL